MSRTARSVVACAIAIGSFAACGASRTVRREAPPRGDGPREAQLAARERSAPRDTDEGDARGEPRLFDERTDALLLEVERLRDWRRTFFVHDQVAPARVRLGVGPFSPEVRQVTAYALGFHVMLSEPGVDPPRAPGAASFVLDEQGRLLSSVIAPGATLGPAQAERLTRLLRGASKWKRVSATRKVGRSSTRCGFAPHLAFVFRDAEQGPLSVLAVSLTCGEWQAEPRAPDLEGGMWPEEGDEIRALCTELGLGACELGSEQWGAVGRRYAALRDSEDLERRVAAHARTLQSGADPDKSVGDVTPLERRRLCLWADEQIRWVHWQTTTSPAGAYSVERSCIDGGRGWRLLPPKECVAAFPTACAATVGATERCMRAALAKPCASHAACAAIPPSCLWATTR